MIPVKRIFVSSTWLDLEPERNAVEEVLANFRETKFVGMEYFGSRDETTRRASLNEVDRCELYIGIIAGRYGSGITRAEYERARERGIECLFYLKDERAIAAAGRDDGEANAGDLEAFKRDVRARHLVRREFAGPHELGQFVSNDLHRWLFDKHLEPLLREAARREETRSAAAELLEAIRDGTALSALTRRMLGEAHLVAGTDRQAALAHYGFLRDHVIPFDTELARETAWFAGRTEIFESLRRFARPGSSGYLCIVADAGLGKTALAAEIAGRFDAPVFFCSTAVGRTGADPCLRHLCAELILRYGLAHDHLPDGAGKDPAFLVKLLAEAVDAAKGPVWLVIDGLDEADDPARGSNPLLLPATLPAGAHILTTQRPTQWRIAASAGTRVTEHEIRWDDVMQRADVEAYLHRQSARPEIAAALAAAVPPIARHVFVESLEIAAQGNFKYLDYVLADIIEGTPEYRPLDLSRLPAGLERYYDQFWSRMGMDRLHENDWALFQPVIALLSIAAEPVSVGWLAAHTGFDGMRVRRQVLVPWRRFLSVRGRAQDETWHIVHKSFADFLATKPELELSQFHARVAEYYLAEPVRWSAHAGYASRHLAAHLHAGGELDRLFELIRRRDWYDAQFAADPSDARFVADVAIAWAAAERLDEAAGFAGEAPAMLAREAACALITATMNSVSSNLRPGLIAQLVKQKRWTPATALAAIAANPDAADRARALARLAPQLNDEASVRHVLRMARALPESVGREPLCALMARLAAIARSEDVLAEASSLDDEGLRAMVLAHAAAHLDAGSLTAAFEWVFAAMVAEEERQGDSGLLNEHSHVNAAVRIVSALPVTLLDRALEIAEADVVRPWATSMLGAAVGTRLAVLGEPRAVDVLRRVENGHYRARGYASALEFMPGALRDETLAFALETAVSSLEANPNAGGAAAFVSIARRAPADSAARALGRVLAVVLRGPGLANHRALGGLAPMLGEIDLRRAIEAVSTWKEEYERRVALTALAVRAIDVYGPERAVSLLSNVGRSDERAEAMVDLVAHIAARAHLPYALDLVRGRALEDFRAQALEAIAPFLPAADVDVALQITDSLPAKNWALAAGAIAERLTELGRPDRALALLRTIKDRIDLWRNLHWSIAYSAASAGDDRNALHVARGVDDVDTRARVYCMLAPVLRRASLCGACADMIEAHNASRHSNPWGEIFWSSYTADALDALVRRLAAEGSIAEALELIPTVEDESVRAALAVLASAPLPPHEREHHQRAFAAGMDGMLASGAWRVEGAVRHLPLDEPAVREALRVLDAHQALNRQRGMSSESLDAVIDRVLLRLAELGHAKEAADRFDWTEALDERPDNFAQMARHLEADSRHALIEDALDALKNKWDHKRSKGLLALAPLFAADLVEPGLDVARSLGEERYRLDASAAIMERFRELESYEAALERGAALGDDALIGGALVAIAGGAPRELLSFAIEATRRLPVEYWSEPVYAAIARRAAELGMQGEALALVAGADLHASPVIEAAAPYLDTAGVRGTLALLETRYIGDSDRAVAALVERLGALGDFPAAIALASRLPTESRANALGAAVRSLPDLPGHVLWQGWQQALRVSGSRKREDALADLAALVALGVRIAGTRWLPELAANARVVSETWP